MVDVKQRNDRIRTLEEENARLRAQVTRLQEAFRIACVAADARRNLSPHSLYYPDMMGEQSLAEMGLQPGDLD